LRIRTLLTAATLGVGSLGVVVGSAPPALAAPCYVKYMRGSAATTGYAVGAYIIAPTASASSAGCAATAVSVVITPAVVGGIPRVATPATCSYPEPEPVPGPDEAYCGAVGGFGSVALGATSYPYLTLNVVAVGIGADGSRSTWNASCTRPVSDPGAAPASCSWTR
jgi:hypothetical protein